MKVRKNIAARHNGGLPEETIGVCFSSGITLQKTSSNSYRFFARVAFRVRVRWMCPGAVLGSVPDITVLLGGGC